MSSNSKTRSILRQAKKHEREYGWHNAAKSYEQVLSSGSTDTSFHAETWQKLGFCYDLASRQSGDTEEFRKLRHLAVEAYESAAELYEKGDRLRDQAMAARCKATASYLLSWLTLDSSEKRKAFDECQKFGATALQIYKKDADNMNYGKTCNTLGLCLFERLYATSAAKEKQLISRKGIAYSKEAISALSRFEDKKELLLAHSIASLQNWYAANISEEEKDRDELARTSLDHSKKALAVSKDFQDPYYNAMSRWAATLSTLFFTGEIETSLKYAEEMLKQGSKVEDNYLKGIAFYLLAFVTDWMVSGESTANKKRERCNDIIRYAKEAIHHLTLVSQDFIIAETYLFYAESHSSLARDVEVDIEKKRASLEKAVDIGTKGLEFAIRSGSPDAKGSTLHALSKALHFFSDLKNKEEERRELLEEALNHRMNYIETVRTAFPSNYWIFGVGKYYEALIEAELARLEIDKDRRRQILDKTVSDMHDGISYCEQWIASRSSSSLTIFVAEFQDRFADVLNQLYQLDLDEAILTQAIEVYDSAAKKYKEVDLPSRTAEIYWKMARNNDRLKKFEEAAASFEDASTQYNTASQRIEQFADFYDDYAIYMKAWNEIEKAKLAHKHEKYAIARKHYINATNLLKESEKWNYLSSNFHALSLMDHAEDLSRNENNAESIKAFEEAAKTFEKVKEHTKKAHAKLKSLKIRDEKEMLTELIEVSDVRREYCIGRINVEEAKILDKKGDHSASSRKYATASKRFQNAINAMRLESDRQEIRPIILICQAWQMMTQAEAETSPELYLEASRLFDKVKENSVSERAKILALGHSQFCKALEAGTKFEVTRDKKLHLVATQHLERAANYYIKAGFKTASEYATATRRLLDCYGYMDNAAMETDPEKKARYYMVAEKVLQTSVESYEKAKHPEKALQVQQLLDKVKEERNLVTSLSEVLHAPTITSSTTSFVTPTPSRENAVGLELFEHTNVQAHLTVPEEIRLNEDLEIQLDLVNVAKNSGLLVRINNLIPKEFRIIGTSPEYDVKDGSIDLGGKTFTPLKVESVKVSARPTDFGVFKVSPQVVYVDETGQFRTCKPQTVNVKVQAPATIARKERLEKKYELVYKDLIKESQRIPKSKCRVAIAQIGVSKSGNILDEFYEEKAGLFSFREDIVETIRAKVENMIRTAHTKEVNVLLFPELTIDLSYDKLLKHIIESANAYGMYIIPGSYHDQKTRHNISMVIGPDGVLWRQEKHIPAIIHHKGERFKEGIDVGDSPRKTLVCNTEFGRMVIAICRDFLDMDLRVELKNFEPAVDIVLNPAFTPVTADFKAVHFDARRSIYAYCFFANVAEFGDSMIYTPEKERVERRIPAGEESIIYKDIDFFQLRSERKKWEKEQRKERRFIQSTR